jgi:protein-L-isoaspartate O-methyltransferase
MMPALDVGPTTNTGATTARSLEAIDIVATIETLVFVLRQLPFGQARILHAGCGNGELAALLGSHGHRVVAIDRAFEAVQRATALGVEARLGEWSEIDDGGFDAILFTGALSRAGSLPAALQRVQQMLAPMGRLIVEEFAREDIDSAAEQWLHTMIARLRTARLAPRRRQRDARRVVPLLLGRTPLPQGDGDEHSMAQLERAIDDALELRVAASAPYLYRFLCELVPKNRWGFGFLREALKDEICAIESGRLNAMGRRLMAQKN